MKADIPALKKAKREKVVEAYTHLTERLRKADLTINFKAHKWFNSPNNYDSYTQMYERGLKGGQMVLSDSDPLNPAKVRAGADDLVTFPNEWGVKKDNFTYNNAKSDWKAHPAGSFQPPQRGLAPGNVSTRLVGKLSPGSLTQVPKPPGTDPAAVTEYTASNPYFDPKRSRYFPPSTTDGVRTAPA